MDIHEELLMFAKETAYPYLLSLPLVADYKDEISVLLVGSVAKGLCTEASDVDMCFLCHNPMQKIITQDYTVMCDEPATVEIDGKQLSYWAIGYEYLVDQLFCFDEIRFDAYGNAIALNDNSGLYAKVKDLIFNEELFSKRKEITITTLLEENNELKQVFETSRDPVYRTKSALHVIELLLKAIALSDHILYDPRKRLYTTSLAGKLGIELTDRVDNLIDSLTNISRGDNDKIQREFIQIVTDCISIIIDYDEKK